MKIIKDETFKPITVVFETQEEWDKFNVVYSDLPKDSVWLPNPGYEPVEPTQLVEVKFYDGEENEGEAGDFWWNNDDEGYWKRITHYRLVCP